MPRRTRQSSRSLHDHLVAALKVQPALRQRSISPEDYLYWIADRLHRRFVHGVALATFLVMAFVFFAALQRAGADDGANRQVIILVALIAVPLCVALAWAIAARLGMPNAAMASAEFVRWTSHAYLQRLSEHDWEHLASFVRAPVEHRRRAYDRIFALAAKTYKKATSLSSVRKFLGWGAVFAVIGFVVTFNQHADANLSALTFPGMFFALGMGFGGVHFVLEGIQHFGEDVYFDASVGTMKGLVAKLNALVWIGVGLAMAFVSAHALLSMFGVITYGY